MLEDIFINFQITKDLYQGIVLFLRIDERFWWASYWRDVFLWNLDL
jgi:hypothetical protein